MSDCEYNSPGEFHHNSCIAITEWFTSFQHAFKAAVYCSSWFVVINCILNIFPNSVNQTPNFLHNITSNFGQTCHQLLWGYLDWYSYCTRDLVPYANKRYEWLSLSNWNQHVYLVWLSYILPQHIYLAWLNNLLLYHSYLAWLINLLPHDVYLAWLNNLLPQHVHVAWLSLSGITQSFLSQYVSSSSHWTPAKGKTLYDLIMMQSPLRPNCIEWACLC